MAKQGEREYSKYWKQILTNHLERKQTTVISCPPDKVNTLKRMISKEKDMDQNWDIKRYFKLTTKQVKDVNGDVTGLEFKLVLYREREIVTSELLRNKL
jgi:hypothetical protein